MTVKLTELQRSKSIKNAIAMVDAGVTNQIYIGQRLVAFFPFPQQRFLSEGSTADNQKI